jgi:hypothetical protein
MAGYSRHKDAPYAIVAEYGTPDEILKAANTLRKAGYKKVESYTPFPVHGMDEAIGYKDQRIPWIVFMGGLTGAVLGFSLQYYTAVWDYPLNIGGRPLMSIPSMIPVTFECTILFASIGAVVGMLGMSLLPQPYHPIFNTPNFRRCSQDRFFLAVEVNDPKFDDVETKALLESTSPLNVAKVEG